MPIRRISLIALAGALPAFGETIALPEYPGEAFISSVVEEIIDVAAFGEWVDGRLSPITPGGGNSGFDPAKLFCTPATNPGHQTFRFGSSANPGPRHFRTGFKAPVTIGTIIAKDGGAVSLLKSGAPFPGDPSDDSQWTSASRVSTSGVTTAEPDDSEDIALWSLPPGTRTRAIRFTHTAKPTDSDYRGTLSGVLVSPNRFADQTTNAVAAAGTNNPSADRIINRRHDGWQAWENHEKGKAKGSTPAISSEHFESITLTWRGPVALDGLIAMWAGIASAEILAFNGPDNLNPKDAPESHWKPVAEYVGIQHNYPSQFWPNFLRFPKTVKTRAIRLRALEAGANKSHANNNDGKRVWLGELMAVRAIGDEPLAAPESELTSEVTPNAPIPVKFHLSRPGIVSLIIEKPDGFRIRNLVSETPFPAGENTVWWDGTDDLGRDADAAEHGVYNIPARHVEPGEYRIRGIVRDEIRPFFEFTVYTTGTPPWSTEDNTGAWLANHTPPQAAAFVPAEHSPTGNPVVYLGSFVTEGPSGLAWVDPATGRKRGGKKWIGGVWTAAPFLAHDNGPKANPETHVYVGSTWETEKGSDIGELRITALTAKGDKEILKLNLGKLKPATPGVSERTEDLLGGIAAHNGTIVASMHLDDKLLFIDATTGKVTEEIPLKMPSGVAFDAQGRLLVISGKSVVRFENDKPVTLISSGLDEPKGITVAADGSIFVSDWGSSHNIKVHSSAGKLVSTIGKPGIPSAGKYDPLRMNRPHGIAIDDRSQLWVTENDYLPKRVSVWSTDGRLVNAFYGPGKYGGGGALDPIDKAKFYYADEGRGTLEFRLDWEKGTWSLENILHRRTEQDLKLSFRAGAPEQALYHEGRRYFTNAWNSNPTGGHGTAFLFVEKDGIARPTAAMGNALRWDVLKTEAFKSRWPDGVDRNAKRDPDLFFIWSDLNDDADVQADEVTFTKGRCGGVTVMPDLSFCLARIEGRTLRLGPIGFTQTGIPIYDISRSNRLASDVKPPASSGGDQALAGKDGWSVVSLGIGSFDSLSICGAKDGIAKWSYPSPWPGLHASHTAPRPSIPGQLIGTTRMPGSMFEVPGVGQLWAIHTNHGRMAVFTSDGIFVANLFLDMRGGKSWKMPAAIRGMELEGLSLGEENFWPTLTHASEGKVYLVDGNRSAIVRLDGFDSIKRLPDTVLTVTPADLDKGRAWRTEVEAARQKTRGGGLMKVAIRSEAPVIDGKLDEWTGSDWVDIDKSGVKAYFNADTKPYNITGAISVTGDKLYAAWKTGSDQPLKNSGEMPLAPFKTGDALDLMIGPSGNRDRPVAGDLRLLVTTVKQKPLALLYRAVVPGTRASDRVPFSSPWRTIHFDKVEDVTSQIEFAGSEGNYELSAPLKALGIAPSSGSRIRGDIGILRGTGNETTARVYWSNKGTGIVSDVPEEAMLNPKLWGTLEFK